MLTATLGSQRASAVHGKTQTSVRDEAQQFERLGMTPLRERLWRTASPREGHAPNGAQKVVLWDDDLKIQGKSVTFAWSYSFLNDFKNCPHKAYRKYVLRDLPKETSEALEEGIRVHKDLEKFINTGEGPGEVSLVGAEAARRFRERGAEAEKKLGMSKQRVAAGFWDPDVWGRGKVDVLIVEGDTALIADWKTGKKREDPFELKVQALLVQTNYPVTYIYGTYVWIKDEALGKMYDLSGVSGVYSEVCEIMHKAEKCGESGRWTKKRNPLCGSATSEWCCPVKDCENWRKG